MSFLNPVFLIAITGALIPVIIHLTRNLQGKKAQFSSLMFLKATPKELIKKRRLRDLILLILRSIIFALLAFAFSRPFFPSDKIRLLASQTDKSVVILIDNSFSMAYQGLFDQARKKAAEIIDDFNSRDECSLLFFSDEAQQITPLSSNQAIHKSALQNKLKISYNTTDFYKPLQLAEEILKDGANPDRQIILISDFQDNGFSDQFEFWKINPEISLIPVKIAPENRINSFVSKFNLKQSRIKGINAAEFRVEIVSHQQDSDKNSTVDLWFNNKLLSQNSIKIQPVNQAFFQQFDLEKGTVQGQIKTEDDNLNADNSFYFTFSVDDLPTILSITNNSRDNNNDSFFLKSAFDIGDESLYLFSTGGLNYINDGRFKKFDLIFLTNVSSFSNRQINLLSDYVNNGGNLIFSVGNDIDIDNYSQVLDHFDIGKIDNKDIIRNPVAQYGMIGQVDFKHPLFSIFVESGINELFRPVFRRFVLISPDSTSRILGEFDSGYPFLIEKSAGSGKVFFYSSSFNTSWTDFPIHDIFVPFLYQLAGYAVSSRTEQTSFLVGETVQLPGNPGEKWQIKTPDGELSDLTVSETGTARFRQTDIPGNYAAQNLNNVYNFSVNVDVRESDLQSRNIEEVQSLISRPEKNRRIELAAAMVSDIEESEKQQKLWFYLILLVISIFIAETYYSNKKRKSSLEVSKTQREKFSTNQ